MDMLIVSFLASFATIVITCFFLKDRWFPKESKELINKVLKDAYMELSQEICHIEKIANNTYNDAELTQKPKNEYAYYDIVEKVAKPLLEIKKYRVLCRKIISIAKKKKENNIRENAKEFFKHSKKLMEKLKKDNNQ